MSDEPAFLTAPPISVESLGGSPGDAGPSAADADDPSRGADVDAYLATLDAAAATNGAAAAAPTDPTVTLADFVARKADNADMLVSCEQGTLLPPAGFGLLVSKSGAGKTTIMADFILHAAAGRDWCGLQFPRPLRVLVIENEGPREAFRQKLERRLASWAAVEGEQQIRVWDDPARWGQVRLSSSEQLAQLRAAADAHQIDLCVSDTLTRFGMRGNGTPEETREFVEDLMTAAGLTRDLAFLLLHHPVTRPDQVSDGLRTHRRRLADHTPTPSSTCRSSPATAPDSASPNSAGPPGSAPPASSPSPPKTRPSSSSPKRPTTTTNPAPKPTNSASSTTSPTTPTPPPTSSKTTSKATPQNSAQHENGSSTPDVSHEPRPATSDSPGRRCAGTPHQKTNPAPSRSPRRGKSRHVPARHKRPQPRLPVYP